jgi:hypothetical protein
MIVASASTPDVGATSAFEVLMSIPFFRAAPLLLALVIAACGDAATAPTALSAITARSSAARTTEPSPDPFEEITVAAAELRAQLDAAWESGTQPNAMGTVSVAPTTLVIPCELLGLRARTATNTAAASGSAVDRAVLRRDLPGAHTALTQFGADVYRGLPIILSYIDCLSNNQPPGNGDGDGNRGPLR